jgi:hypothetical protein
MNVADTIRSVDDPAARRMASTLRKHCLVCSWIVPPTIAPVAGSNGPWPVTNTRPAATTAWLYGNPRSGSGLGASGVLMITLVMARASGDWRPTGGWRPGWSLGR